MKGIEVISLTKLRNPTSFAPKRRQRPGCRSRAVARSIRSRTAVLKGNPAELIGVKRALAHVPVRKPNKQEFIRTHHDPAFRLSVAILELKTEREFYVLLPEVAAELPAKRVPLC